MLLGVGLGTLHAPIETAKYSKEVLSGENPYRCGPVWAGVVQPDNKEADAVRTPVVFLRIHLGL